MKNSHIEWTDHTFNPWEGCTKVSPGCAHCYAEARDVRFTGGIHWGKGAPRRRTRPENWKQPLRWNRDCEDHPVPAHLYNRRARVFCASLADWLDDEVPVEWLADLLDLIRRTPNLDWLLLTKRPELWRNRMLSALDYMGKDKRFEHMVTADWLAWWIDGKKPPSNVWIGTTVEDQQRADERIPELLKIPAKVRFLSCEPLLGPVGLSEWLSAPHIAGIVHAQRTRHDGGYGGSYTCDDCDFERDDTIGIHWVICGGESGKDARPMHPDWARSLRDQCAAAGVPFFFKQWGEWAPIHGTGRVTGDEATVARPFGWVSPAGVVRASGCLPDALMLRVGKHAAGRRLDGEEHSAFPEIQNPQSKIKNP